MSGVRDVSDKTCACAGCCRSPILAVGSGSGSRKTFYFLPASRSAAVREASSCIDGQACRRPRRAAAWPASVEPRAAVLPAGCCHRRAPTRVPPMAVSRQARHRWPGRRDDRFGSRAGRPVLRAGAGVGGAGRAGRAAEGGVVCRPGRGRTRPRTSPVRCPAAAPHGARYRDERGNRRTRSEHLPHVPRRWLTGSSCRSGNAGPFSGRMDVAGQDVPVVATLSGSDRGRRRPGLGRDARQAGVPGVRCRRPAGRPLFAGQPGDARR